MHAQAERGLAAHWAYKEGKPVDDVKVPWIEDLVEILDHADSPEELLEHTRMAMYQDRIFAFTPKGELIQLPKGATPVDFAYAVHTALGDKTVGAKVNGRVVPLRTLLDNGDQVEILISDAQHPQPSWLRFVVTGKARSSVRRFVRHKERDETIELGHKIYDEIVARLPAAARPRSARPGDQEIEAGGCRRVDDGDRPQATDRRSGDGSADAGIGRQRHRAAPLGPAPGDLDQGADPGRRLQPGQLLPPDSRRPNRRASPRG